MSRYTQEELRKMANDCLEARDKGILDWFHLVETLSRVFRMPQQIVEMKIVELSRLKE